MWVLLHHRDLSTFPKQVQGQIDGCLARVAAPACGGRDQLRHGIDRAAPAQRTRRIDEAEQPVQPFPNGGQRLLVPSRQVQPAARRLRDGDAVLEGARPVSSTR
jgi:hypothetical protein